MDSSVRKGKASLEKAESMLPTPFWGLLSWFLSDSRSQYEDAAEEFVRAGTHFKMAKDFTSAAAAFTRASDCYARCGEQALAAARLGDAAACARHNGQPAAHADVTASMARAAELYCSNGNLSSAARLFQDIGDLNRGAGEFQSAAEAYQRAADLYEAESKPSLATGCIVVVAEVLAQAGKHQEAAETFETAARHCRSGGRPKGFQVQEHLLRAAICHVAAEDLVAARRAYDQCVGHERSFAEHRNGVLLNRVIDAVDPRDAAALTDVVDEFEYRTAPSPWMLSMLRSIQETFATASELA
eukprot:TRINITY_DN15511_c0_g1_i1.p1 TRINITY_DN15511_c0_g1~~TRINITY_DN15511_c0_g1_i1.p1  ORF type:complete len:300 (-),score=69.66 TRINITY_DN15511_c0_g1_i1:206-1105(-)